MDHNCFYLLPRELDAEQHIDFNVHPVTVETLHD